MTTRALSVVRALAMLGAAGATQLAAEPSYGQRAPTQYPRACPTRRPPDNSSCAGFTHGQWCEWHGVVRCLCGTGAQNQRHPHSPPTWDCAVRSVPGPLAPPELLA